MARTIEELDHDISTLKGDVDLLKRQQASWSQLVERFAGCFTDDLEWAAIHEQIEAERRIPAPEEGGH